MSPLKDIEEVVVMGYDPKFDFTTIDFLRCVIPIADGSLKTQDGIVGTSFLLKLDKISYLVTANHVIRKIDNPLIHFSGINEQDIVIGTQALNRYGIDWISQPEHDIAVLPAILPKQLLKKISNKHIIHKKFIEITTIQKGAKIKHIGFGEKKIGYHEKSKKPFILMGTAFGLFEKTSKGKIFVKSPARFGDSGSPLFVKTKTGGALIGVLTETETISKITNKNDGEYTGKTTAVPLKHVLEIINSKEMKMMVNSAKKKISLENGGKSN